MNHLAQCPQLKYVDFWLCENGITDRAAEYLGKCSQLIHADFRCTGATPAAMNHLANCLQLQHLGIEFNIWNCLEDELPALPSLISLSLHNCGYLFDPDVSLL